MLHKNIIKLSALLWCVLTVASCTNEDFDKGNNGPDVPEGLPVTLKLNIGTPEVPVVETKSLDNGATFGAINDLAVLVYDEKGENPIVTFHEVEGENQTSVNNMTFDAKTGKHKIYVLANVGSEDAAKEYTTEQALLSKQIESQEPMGTEMMLGFVAKDMETSINLYNSGNNEVIDITGDASFAAKVVPPYSKITFKITKDLPRDKHVYLAITEVNVRHLPVKYSLLPYEKWTMDNGVSGESIISLYENKSAKPEDEVDGLATGRDFYMYENLQGENNINNDDPSLKTPVGLEVPTIGDGKIDYTEWFKKWSSVPCTYIEVKGNYTIFTSEPGVNHVGDGEINYRFFLGENSTSDFNIKRNTHYNVTLAFTGLAGKNELQYEWRVQADLENSTFYPKGTLVIDGAPSTIGIVPFYVVNNSGSAVNMTTDGYTGSDMKVFYETTESGYWTNASTATVEVKNNNYSKLGVASNYIGIIGSQGHTSIYGENNEYKNQNTNTEVKEESDNYTLRDQVANGTIYRKRDFKLNTGETIEVHEYPLLYLGDLSSGIGAAGYSAYYARRVDGGSYSVGESWLNQWETKSGKVQSVQDAKLLCNDQYGTMNIDYIQSVSGTAYIISLLPTQEDIKKIIYHEKKFQLKDEAYWTRDAGLVSGKTGERTTSRDGGYVRCVYKSKGLLK